jgi:hypothetical protein
MINDTFARDNDKIHLNCYPEVGALNEIASVCELEYEDCKVAHSARLTLTRDPPRGGDNTVSGCTSSVPMTLGGGTMA